MLFKVAPYLQKHTNLIGPNYKDVEAAPRNHNSMLQQSKFRQSSSHFLIVIRYHQSILEVLRGKQIKLNYKFIRVLRFAFRYLPRVGVLSPMHIVLEYIRNSLDFCADWRKFLYYNPILTHIILVQVNKRCPNSIFYYRMVSIVSSTPASTSTSRRSFFFL